MRFTLELPRREVHKWREWAKSKGSSAEIMASLASAGGSGTWRVVERPISRVEWVDVIDTASGDSLLGANPKALAALYPEYFGKGSITYRMAGRRLHRMAYGTKTT